MGNGESVEKQPARNDGLAVAEANTWDSPQFWRWTTLGLGAIAFAKGLREPNAWSYTQAQFDYSVGFMRRGLFGTMVGRPLGLGQYGHFVVVSTLLLLLLFAALALLARTSKVVERTPPGELLAVYASSYSVTYLANLNGYLDIPLALLCVAPLFLRSTAWRLLAALACATAGILIHEQFFFAFLPLLVVSVLFGAGTAQSERQRRVAWAGGVALLLIGVALVAYLGRHASITQAQADQLRTANSLKADRWLEPEVFKVLPRTPQENLAVMRSVWARPTFWPAQVESLLFFCPTAAVLSWATLLLLRRWMPGRHRWLYAGAVMATLAPLSLHLFGWDKSRWNELLCLNAFLMLLLVSRLFGGDPVRLPANLRRACIVVMLLNMATGGGMLDNRHIRPFPFLRRPDGIHAEGSVAGP